MRTHNPERSRKSRSCWNRARARAGRQQGQAILHPRLTHKLFRQATKGQSERAPSTRPRPIRTRMKR